MKAVLKLSVFCVHEDGVEPDHTVSQLKEIESLINAV